MAPETIETPGRPPGNLWETLAMSERLQDILAGAEPGLDQLKDQAQIYAAAASERLIEGRDRIRQYIINEPARALGIALGVGVLLGWLIKRR